ncbi:uncharacterized protein LOC131937477 [Physella acuta]|uniref:uncharacterized protein LOC131937477 n=1 Tax=Physella acuta TaxID=109671 RepID=UPI0027DC05DE|nr:uncharacterized protein LOC131937477 [Physella acuta]XP_059150935.1 uncharacterized protein LOC131937477 [Physella acuta]XP_059150936.1 uncharacterized protein LOC131937477 [Physella acuta]XP_059150937.1 uncharacterized protein LOC131937477 [Physella acuta]
MDKLLESINNTLLQDHSDIEKVTMLIVLSELLDANHADNSFRETLTQSGICENLLTFLKGHQELVDIEQNKPPFLLICHLAMKCIMCFYSSKINPSSLDSAVVEVLLNYLKPYTSNHFYQFTQKYNSSLKELIENASSDLEIILHCKASQNIFTEELPFYEAEMANLSDSVYICSLRVPPKGEIVSDYLVNQSLVWKSASNFEGLKEEDKKQPQEMWKKARITHVLKGNFFWMLCGEECIKTADNIYGSLSSPKLELIKIQAKPDEIVVAEIESGCKFFRGYVISETCGQYTVFNVDSGKVHQTRDVYFLPPDLSLTNIPALANLGYLEGVMPLPLDASIVAFATSVISSIVRFNLSAIDEVMDKGILDILPDLMTSPDLEVATQSMRLGANLLLKKKTSFCEKWQRILFVTLETLKKALTNAETAGYNILINSCLLLVMNRIFMCPEAKNFFYTMKGLQIVLRTRVIFQKHFLIHKSVVQVLANFVHATAQSFPQRPASSQPPRKYEAGQFDRKDFYNKQKYTSNGAFKGIGYELDSDEECSESKHSDSSDDFWQRKPEKKNEDEKTYYLLGEKVKFTCDSEHEIHLSWNLSAETLAKTFCGMLNSGLGGKVYIGIDEESVVHGETLNQNIRDELRLGLDQVMTKITPAILHNQFDIKFIPVLASAQSPATDLFVVVMGCKPVPNVIYSCNAEECYYRLGATTSIFCHQDIRELCVIEEESLYMNEIKTLQEELAHLKAVLNTVSP